MISAAGITNASTMKMYLMLLTKLSLLPWKNSRVLNEPPMAPCAFCAMLVWRTPMAERRSDFGRSRLLRISEAPRNTSPATVNSSAQPA